MLLDEVQSTRPVHMKTNRKRRRTDDSFEDSGPMITSSSSHQPIFHEWNNLPNEMKCEIIRKMGNNTRLALKATAHREMNLVNSVPFGKIDMLVLTSSEDQFTIETRHLPDLYAQFYDFRSPKPFKAKIISIMKDLHYIGELRIRIDNWAQLFGKEWLKFKINDEKVHVRDLQILDYSAIEVLRLIEPFSLESFYIYSDEKQLELYDTPQVIHAKNISVKRSFMGDEHLSKLNACKIHIDTVENITESGVNMFIKKILRNPDFISFSLPRPRFKEITDGLDFVKSNVGPEEVIWITRPFHDQLVLTSMYQYYLSGKIIKNASDHLEQTFLTKFKSLSYCKINYDSLDLTIFDEEHSSYKQQFHSIDELQRAVIELISQAVFIKSLGITISEEFEHDYVLAGKGTKLAVAGIKIITLKENEREHMLINLMQQFETRFIEELTFPCIDIPDNEVFDTEQVRQAAVIFIEYCHMTDEQLLQLNAHQLELRSTKFTASGVNKLIKKWLKEWKHKNYAFVILDLEVPDGKSEWDNEVQILDGLEIASRKKHAFGKPDLILLKTQCPDTHFVLFYNGPLLQGRRIEKDQRWLDFDEEWT